jgi:hypothetical protein
MKNKCFLEYYDKFTSYLKSANREIHLIRLRGITEVWAVKMFIEESLEIN